MQPDPKIHTDKTAEPAPEQKTTTSGPARVASSKLHRPEDDDQPLGPVQKLALDTELTRIEAEADQKEATGQAITAPLDESYGPVHMVGHQPTWQDRIKELLRSKKFWIVTGLSVLIILAGMWFVQPIRIWLVNAVGARTTVTLSAAVPGDGKQSAGKLKNAQVATGGREFKTDANGTVVITGQPYGAVVLTVKKSGYQEVTKQLYLDFDPFFNLLGGTQFDALSRQIAVDMPAVGLPVSFKVADWLSGSAIKTGEFSVSDLSVKPDDQGLVSFKVPPAFVTGNKFTMASNFGPGGAYIDKRFELTTGVKDVPTISFVPAGKQYFLSKRSGALGVYGSNIDASNTEELVPGTGKETDTTALAISPSGQYGLLASTREDSKNDKGDVQQRLYVVDLKSRQLTKVDEGDSFRFIDWSGDLLAYVRKTTDTKTDKQTEDLRSADVAAKKAYDIASSSGVSQAYVSFDKVLYTTTGEAGDEKSPVASVNSIKGGSAKEQGQRINSSKQTDFDKVVFQTLADRKWHEYNFNTSSLKDVASPNSVQRAFINSFNSTKTKHILIDRIDGKFVITSKTSADGAEKQLYRAANITGPIRWLGNEVITFRAGSSDYAVSVNGGEPKKITDVTATKNSGSASVFQPY